MTTQEILEAARAAKQAVALASSRTRQSVLERMADALRAPDSVEAILAANAEDMAAAKGHISDVMLDRLALTPERIGAMAKGILEVAALPDPVGAVLNRVERPNGLVIEKTAVPMGVIAIIYESRPNVTSDAAALAIKSGNACILRCGKEAWRSANAIVTVLRQGLKKAGLPETSVCLIEDTTHASANALMTAVGYVDLLIPRGGAGLIRACVENAKVPCIQTGTGICHIYVDANCDVQMAARIAVDAKTQYPAACNAAETLLIHSARLRDALPVIGRALVEAGVELHADERAREVLYACGVASQKATQEDWGHEYLAPEMAVRVVDSLEEVITYINAHGSHHTDCIVTRDEGAAGKFFALVDSAGVYQNCSTRFADGYRYGFGAEVGISTGKIHARGPMGLEGLCSYKYILRGHGDIVADFADGRRSFTHKKLL